MKPVDDPDVWQYLPLAAYARTEARFLEALQSAESVTSESGILELELRTVKLYAACGRPFGPSSRAMRVWRRFGGREIAN